MNTFQINDIVKHFVGQANVIATPAIFKKWLGTYNAAILFSQIIYWSDRTQDADGWFYKSYKDWENEVFLTEREAQLVVKQLENLGLIETKIAKVSGNPTKHYRLKTDVFQELFVAYLKAEKISQTVDSKGSEGNLPNVGKETYQTSVSYTSQKLLTKQEETTTYTPARESEPAQSVQPLAPSGVTSPPFASDNPDELPPEPSPHLRKFPHLEREPLAVGTLNEIAELFCHIAEQQNRQTLIGEYDWIQIVKKLHFSEGMSVFGIKSLYRYCKERCSIATVTPKVLDWKFAEYKRFVENQRNVTV